MAIHMGIPIFMDGEFSPAESGSVAHFHEVHDHEAAGKAGPEPADDNPEIETGVTTPIPRAFQDLIDGPRNAGKRRSSRRATRPGRRTIVIP